MSSCYKDCNASNMCGGIKNYPNNCYDQSYGYYQNCTYQWVTESYITHYEWSYGNYCSQESSPIYCLSEHLWETNENFWQKYNDCSRLCQSANTENGYNYQVCNFGQSMYVVCRNPYQRYHFNGGCVDPVLDIYYTVWMNVGCWQHLPVYGQREVYQQVCTQEYGYYCQ